MSFRQDVIIYGNIFPNFNSILAVAYSFIGGIGFLFGPISGATLAPGSIGANISNELFSGISRWVPTIGGVIVVALVLQNQDGLTKEQLNILPVIAKRGKTLVLSLIIGLVAFLVLKSSLDVHGGGAWLLWLACMPLFGILSAKFLTRFVEPHLDAFVGMLAPLGRLTRPFSTGGVLLAEAADVRDRVQARTLTVEGLTVRYGGVTAVDDLDFVVEPGTIVGLIGPNGAGKTSAIDAITGFASASGTVLLDKQDLSALSVPKRTRAGISRSFQSLELFEDSTVLDNIRAASDPRDRMSYLRDLVYPKSPPLPSQVVAAIREFRLDDVLDRLVQDLPYGQRRLLAIARAVATQPSVLLLDEPAAGLGDVETAELARLVRRLADDWGMAVLLVEHDMNFVMSVCDEIVVLDFGRKIAAGPREEVRVDPVVIAAYLGDSEEEHVDEVVDAMSAGEILLQVSGLTAGYGAQAVIHDIDIEVRSGEVVTLLGPNGAGKTTTLLAMSGELPTLSGEVAINGAVTRAPLFKRARGGLTFVTEERSVFKALSTRDNLRVGGVSTEARSRCFPSWNVGSTCVAACCPAASNRC